jgi:DNA-directed RNA polymerase specialized sigma24 family protein
MPTILNPAVPVTGLSAEEIAAALNVSRNTVFRYLREAPSTCLESS